MPLLINAGEQALCDQKSRYQLRRFNIRNVMDRYAVFGHPIAHSQSPRIHQLFAAQTGHSLVYDARQVCADNFQSALHTFFASDGKGANITAPFKQAAFQLADRVTQRAQVGAVNTLKRCRDGRLLGDNTDGIGLLRDLIRLDMAPYHQRILLLGAGGAARAILFTLLAEKPYAVVLSNRTFTKAAQLAAEFATDGPVKAMPIAALIEPFDLIINATGLHPPCMTLSPALLTAHSACYDLSYQRQLTPFLCWAKQHNIACWADGLGMLVEQAAYAFQVWHHIMPDTRPVLAMLSRELQQTALLDHEPVSEPQC